MNPMIIGVVQKISIIYKATANNVKIMSRATSFLPIPFYTAI